MTSKPDTKLNYPAKLFSLPSVARNFARLGKVVEGVCGLMALTYFYGTWEAERLQVCHQSVVIPKLPTALDGTTIALITDLHHGETTRLDYIRRVVSVTNDLRPDVVALGGDYVFRYRKYIEPCAGELGHLQAPLGVYAVLGNHDHWNGVLQVQQALEDEGIKVLNNNGVWLARSGAKLRIAGIGDLWAGTQDVRTAIGNAAPEDVVVLLSHNPEYVEQLEDNCVDLVLSGHNHGGQFCLPLVGSPIMAVAPVVFRVSLSLSRIAARHHWRVVSDWVKSIPPILRSQHGQKYRSGLVKTEHTQVYVSRGIGTVELGIRLFCRPEITLITLKQQ